MKIQSLFAVAGFVLVATIAPADAQDEYPSKPIKIVVPWSPGGSSDSLARVLSVQLSQEIGANVLVENRPGAGSRVGTEYAARSAADGYTLLLADMPFAITPNLYQDVAYDPVESFEAIGMVGVAPMILFTSPDGPQSLEEFVETAKFADPSLTIGSGGIGSTTYMMGEMIKSELGVDLLSIPYGGAGPSLQALAGGEVDVAFSVLATGFPLIEANLIRTLAATSPEPTAALPETPTFTSLGYDLTAQHWWGLLGPSGTPEPVIESLQQAMAKVLATPEVVERLTELGVVEPSVQPEEFEAFVASESLRWQGIIDDNDITIE